jgi:hypothetical protein
MRKRPIVFEDVAAIEDILDEPPATLDNVQELRIQLMRCGEVESKQLAALERWILTGTLTIAGKVAYCGKPTVADLAEMAQRLYGFKPRNANRVSQFDRLVPLTRIAVSYWHDPALDVVCVEADYDPRRGLDDDWPEPVPEPANLWLQGRTCPAKRPVSKLPDHMKRIKR